MWGPEQWGPILRVRPRGLTEAPTCARRQATRQESLGADGLFFASGAPRPSLADDGCPMSLPLRQQRGGSLSFGPVGAVCLWHAQSRVILCLSIHPFVCLSVSQSACLLACLLFCLYMCIIYIYIYVCAT